MPRTLASFLALMLGVGAMQPVLAQEIPENMAEHAYASQRSRLIRAGWQKVIVAGKNCKALEAAHRAACQQYPELDRCTEHSDCSFLWRDSHGLYLRIYTAGDDHTVVGYSHPAVHPGSAN